MKVNPYYCFTLADVNRSYLPDAHYWIFLNPNTAQGADFLKIALPPTRRFDPRLNAFRGSPLALDLRPRYIEQVNP